MPVQPTFPFVQPPPEVPASVKDMRLADYLRRLSLWCKNSFAGKTDTGVALPGVLLQAYDATPGTTPAVWLIRVNSQGVLQSVSQDLGSGQP